MTARLETGELCAYGRVWPGPNPCFNFRLVGSSLCGGHTDARNAADLDQVGKFHDRRFEARHGLTGPDGLDVR